MRQPLGSNASSPSYSYYDVFTALTLLQGRSTLIRHRLDRMPAEQRPAITATLDVIEAQVAILNEQLATAQRVGLGPPF